MRLKLYRASTIAGAMSQIRVEMGPDALILATRRVAGGIEVTAAIEPEPEPPLAPPPVPALPRHDPARAAALAWHGVPQALATDLQHLDLAAALDARLCFAPLPLSPTPEPPRPLMVAGPPGAGKTLTIARLATRLVMAGLPPMVITADGQRAGATEQLLAFTRLLGVSLIVADHPATLARALARRGAEPVLIDTPGLDLTDTGARDLLAALGATAGANTALVLPAGLDANEAADLAGAAAQAGATHMVATRLDLSRRLGGILAAADAGRLALAEAGIGPGAADGLAALTPAFLADRLGSGAAPRSISPHKGAA